jgi:hypothetical protein
VRRRHMTEYNDGHLVHTTSHLPSWVLRMREKIEASRLLHEVAQQRLHQIKDNVGELSVKLEAFAPRMALNIPLSRSTPPRSPLSTFHSITSLPGDCFQQILQFSSINEVFRLLTVNRTIAMMVEGSYYWSVVGASVYQFMFSGADNSVPPHDRFAKIRRHRIMCRRSYYFLDLMKDQRSVMKRSMVQPHVYSRSERTVSHPIPLFDRSTNSDKVMSTSDTLSSDFRAVAHFSLEIMVILTGWLYVTVAEGLVERGVVSVMVSLLSNEESSLQNYACQVLGNLLLWGAACTKTSNLASQLDACDARRKLSKLLTSPTASVNLAIPKSSGTWNANCVTSASQLTSKIQGVCNKSASRALICYLCPDAPVNSYTVSQRSSNMNGIVDWAVLEAGGDSLWQFKYFYKSGAFKDQMFVELRFCSDLSLRGCGRDEIGSFSLIGVQQIDIVGPVLMLEKSYGTGFVTLEYSSTPTVVHVKHVGYWSEELQVGSSFRDSLM